MVLNLLCWYIALYAATISQEFGPDISHISGVNNIVADAISRLPTANKHESEPHTEVQRLKKNFTNNEANDFSLRIEEAFHWICFSYVKHNNKSSTQIITSLSKF